ncbi:MAG TPA: OsmC family protein [Chloroflexota bacterium]
MAEKAARVNLGFDQEQLEGLIGAVKDAPERGQTVWKATTSWLGGFASQAQIRDFTVRMDEPPPLGGADSGPNMVEVVLGAYGCCLTTGYVMNAGLKGIKLEGVEIELEGDLDLRGFFGLAEGVTPGYSGVRATVHLKAPAATPEQIQELHELVTRTSPVGAIIGRPVTVATELAS